MQFVLLCYTEWDLHPWVKHTVWGPRDVLQSSSFSISPASPIPHTLSMPLWVQITESVVIRPLHGDTQRDKWTQQIFTYCFLAINPPHLGHHLSNAISSRSFGLSSCSLNPSHFWLECLTFPCDPPVYISAPTHASLPSSPPPLPLWLLSRLTLELPAGFFQWPYKHWDVIQIPRLPIKSEIFSSRLPVYDNAQLTLNLVVCLMNHTLWWQNMFGDIATHMALTIAKHFSVPVKTSGRVGSYSTSCYLWTLNTNTEDLSSAVS